MKKANKQNLSKSNFFTQKEVDSFVSLGALLRKVHDRLIAEGYIIQDGKILPPEKKL